MRVLDLITQKFPVYIPDYRKVVRIKNDNFEILEKDQWVTSKDIPFYLLVSEGKIIYPTQDYARIKDSILTVELHILDNVLQESHRSALQEVIAAARPPQETSFVRIMEFLKAKG